MSKVINMTIEVLHSGIRISGVYNGYLVSKLYIGYGKREAKRLFKMYVNNIAR